MNNKFEIGKEQWKRLMQIVACIVAVSCLIILVFFHTDVFIRIAKKWIGILEPFIWGAVIAYLLRPVCLIIERFLGRLEHRLCKKEHPGIKRLIAMLVSILLMLAVLVILLLAVLPQLITSISGLITQIPSALETFQNWMRSLDQGGASHEIITAIESAVSTLSERLRNFLQTDVLPNLTSLVTNVTSSFMVLVDLVKNFGLGCIIAAYLLGSWERFSVQIKLMTYALFPTRTADWLKKEVLFADRMFSGFIHGKLLDSAIIGVICYVFMLATGMPYAVLVAVIVGVTNIIPFFGPYIGAIPSFILILTISPGQSIVFLIFVILLQQFDGNILGPAILGDRLGLSGFWILFSIMVFSSLFGIVGMIIGVPLFAVIYDLIRTAVHFLLKKRSREDLAGAYQETFGADTDQKNDGKKDEKEA